MQACPHCHRPLEPEALRPNPLVLPLSITMANALDAYEALREIADRELPACGSRGEIITVSTGHRFAFLIATEYLDGELGRNKISVGSWELLLPNGRSSGLLFNRVEL